MAALMELAAADRRITFITGDLGFSVVEKFAEKYPDQFVNAGVAEQNMTGIAAGMAMSGRIVFTYSIANFATIRCLEQIRNDVCYHGADVKVVAVGGGLAYGSLGHSHHALEDLAIMRALPQMCVVAPGDPAEAAAATVAVANSPGPWYLRLGKAGESRCHDSPIDFELGKALRIREGAEATILCTGGILSVALEAVELLAAAGREVGLMSMHTVKPLDAEAVLEAGGRAPRLVTIEEHSVIGGLGSAVGETLLRHGQMSVKLLTLGVPSGFIDLVGSQDELRARYSLDPVSVAAQITDFLAA